MYQAFLTFWPLLQSPASFLAHSMAQSDSFIPGLHLSTFQIYIMYLLCLLFMVYLPLQCKLQHSRELCLFTSLGSVCKTVPGSNRCSRITAELTLSLLGSALALSFFFFGHTRACRILVPLKRIRPRRRLEVPSLNHWTARESPVFPSDLANSSS